MTNEHTMTLMLHSITDTSDNRDVLWDTECSFDVRLFGESCTGEEIVSAARDFAKRVVMEKVTVIETSDFTFTASPGEAPEGIVYVRGGKMLDGALSLLGAAREVFR